MEYGRYWIHIMHFENVFQYLFADKKGNIYQHYITFPANPLRWLGFKMGLRETMFSIEEMELGEKLVLSGAMTSIDAVIEKEERTKKELREASKIVNSLKKDKRCMWRAVEMENGMNYQCLIHDVYVPMKDGEIPAHEITKETKVLSPLQISQEE